MDADDPQPFEQTMLPHLDAAYTLARWLLRHEQDAEDAVQDAFLRAYRAFGRFRGGDGRAWLLTIVRNVCYTRLRVTRGAPRPEVFEEELHSPTANHTDMTNVAANSELLNEALGRLEPEFREALVLHEIEGLAYRDIAQVIDCPIGTVMSRISRARQKLERELNLLASSHGL